MNIHVGTKDGSNMIIGWNPGDEFRIFMYILLRRTGRNSIDIPRSLTPESIFSRTWCRKMDVHSSGASQMSSRSLFRNSGICISVRSDSAGLSSSPSAAASSVAGSSAAAPSAAAPSVDDDTVTDVDIDSNDGFENLDEGEDKGEDEGEDEEEESSRSKAYKEALCLFKGSPLLPFFRHIFRKVWLWLWYFAFCLSMFVYSPIFVKTNSSPFLKLHLVFQAQGFTDEAPQVPIDIPSTNLKRLVAYAHKVLSGMMHSCMILRMYSKYAFV
ncbi:hypothetical protein BKA57DRAFT_475175 [Linnemannia elongata]|nr:hypothetical protein BKA57DRAFT_475175 [Linnemannia elongata]